MFNDLLREVADEKDKIRELKMDAIKKAEAQGIGSYLNDFDFCDIEEESLTKSNLKDPSAGSSRDMK